MSPHAMLHHQWHGWPGLWSFAEAAIKVTHKRAAITQPTPAPEVLKPQTEDCSTCKTSNTYMHDEQVSMPDACIGCARQGTVKYLHWQPRTTGSPA